MSRLLPLLILAACRAAPSPVAVAPQPRLVVPELESEAEPEPSPSPELVGIPAEQRSTEHLPRPCVTPPQRSWRVAPSQRALEGAGAVWEIGGHARWDLDEVRTYRFDGRRLRASLELREETCRACRTHSCVIVD